MIFGNLLVTSQICLYNLSDRYDLANQLVSSRLGICPWVLDHLGYLIPTWVGLVFPPSFAVSWVPLEIFPLMAVLLCILTLETWADRCLNLPSPWALWSPFWNHDSRILAVIGTSLVELNYHLLGFFHWLTLLNCHPHSALVIILPFPFPAGSSLLVALDSSIFWFAILWPGLWTLCLMILHGIFSWGSLLALPYFLQVLWFFIL